ncbi:MAG: hypothetical protein MK213_04035 [Planctomycetes bacterium]|nr:hypothetical protein [Planctomycetota bacterium]
MLLRSLACFGVLAFAAPTLSAQNSPEAWVSRLHALKKKPVTLSSLQTMERNGIQQSAVGTLAILDLDHFRVSTEMTISGKGMDHPIVRTMVNVGDGEYFWMQAIEQGQSQVGRLPLNEWAERAKKSGGAFSSIHPVDFVLQLIEYVDLEEAKLDEKTVTLTGAFTEEAKSRLINDFRGGVPRTLTLVLDRETGFPASFEVRSYLLQLVHTKYEDVKFPKAKEMDPKLFLFDLPPGTRIQEAPKAPAPQGGNTKK